MTKTRTVIVVSPKISGRSDLATVVPISSSEPDPLLPHHWEVPTRFLPDFMVDDEPRWAKCDMVYTLCIDRLEPIKKGKDRKTGKRTYEQKKLDLEALREVRKCVALALGILKPE